jgi:hypothetical protein
MSENAAGGQHAPTGAGPLVLLIGGTQRSGSTILGNVLAQLEGFAHVGELRFIWREQATSGRVCGCGAMVSDCEFWQEVIARASSDPSWPTDPASMRSYALRNISYRPRPLWSTCVPTRSGRGFSISAATPTALRYAAALGALYRAVAAVSNSPIVIDSSKHALHVWLAARRAGVRAHVLHLIRDPRAAAYSWQRRDIEGVTYGVTKVAVNWLVTNLALEALHRRYPEIGYTRLRYEDFVSRPAQTVAEIQAACGMDSPLPFVDGATSLIRPTHTLAGNPVRFDTGAVRLSLDDEWQGAMEPMPKALTGLITAPMLHRYGYRITLR